MNRPKKIRLQVTLKSGAQVEFDCIDWEFQKGQLGPRTFRWDATGCDNKLIHVDLDEVAAIVRLSR